MKTDSNSEQQLLWSRKRRKDRSASETGAVQLSILHHTWFGAWALAFCMRQPEHHQRRNLKALTSRGISYNAFCTELPLQDKDMTCQYRGLYYHPSITGLYGSPNTNLC